MKKIRFLQEKTATEYLYFAGGSALNIRLNRLIWQSGCFSDVFVPPCAGDSGLAIGAAVCLEIAKGNMVNYHSPYLNNWRIFDYQCWYNKSDIEKLADILLENKIIGVCNQFAEAGPRALGNRSIIALANSVQLAEKLSIKHKGREWYRPVAPIMLEKNVKYFTGLNNIPLVLKYMLYSFGILKSKQNEISGAVHADGTSRIQTIFSKEDNPFIFDLLSHFDAKHQVKAFLNTSFNEKGQPMVHSEQDAREAAAKMKLDGLVVNGKMV